MRIGLYILLVVASSAAHAASFDCAKAKTPQEKAICSSPSLSKADEEMAAAYHAVLTAAPSKMKEEVRTDQRDWLGELPLECPSGRQRFGQDIVACLQQAYDRRNKALNHLVLRKNRVTFVWRSILLMNREESASDESEQEARAEIETITGYGTLNVSWPQTNRATAKWSAWNRAILEKAQKLASQGHATSDRQWRTEWAADDDGELYVTIGVVNGQMVSAFVDRWGFRGAHPWETSMNLNWMLNAQRELRSDDVFQPNSKWDQVIEERCLSDLVTVLGQHYENSDYGPDSLPGAILEIIRDPENWQLDVKGLTIVFQDYAMAPRTVHPGPVTISWIALKPYLNPTFQIPR
jgi:uncharacterized protein